MREVVWVMELFNLTIVVVKTVCICQIHKLYIKMSELL